MAKNKNAAKEQQKAPEVKKPKEEKKAPKAGEKAPEEKKEKTTPVGPTPDTIMMMRNSEQFRGMSQDSKVTYADLLQRRYIEHPVEGANYTPLFLAGINAMIDATVLSIAVDEAVCGSGSLAFIIKKNPTVYAGLTNMAKDMGIENLPAFTALPQPTQAQLEKAGIQSANAEELAVVEIKEKNVSKETKKAAKEEHKIAEKQVELDGSKIKDEAGLIEAVKHRLVKDKSSSYRNLIDVVYLTLKPFRMANAANDEEKAKYESFTLYDWLMDAFALVPPTIVYKGIGRGMVTVTKFAKNPIRAFIIGRASTMDRKQVAEGHPNPGLKDEETVQMVKAIINWICNTDIRAKKAELELEDVKKDAKQVAKLENEVKDLELVINVVNNPSMDFVDKLIENKESDEVSKTIYNDILGNYFGKPYQSQNMEEPLSKKYKNIDFAVQQIAGAIINLFVPSTQQDDRYSFDNGFQKLEEYTQEELLENKKKEKSQKKHRGVA